MFDVFGSEVFGIVYERLIKECCLYGGFKEVLIQIASNGQVNIVTVDKYMIHRFGFNFYSQHIVLIG